MPASRLAAAVLAVLALRTGGLSAAEVSFERDVMPVLSRAGCNAGACHGNLNGKGGLKLSLKGEDPAADLAALTRDMLGRRTDPHRPAESLLLQKATGQVPHEGGTRFSAHTTEYAAVRAWIAAGCRPDPPGGPRLAALDVTPRSRILVDPDDRFRIRAVARFTDGTSRDVTPVATFEQTAVGVAKITPDRRGRPRADRRDGRARPLPRPGGGRCAPSSCRTARSRTWGTCRPTQRDRPARAGPAEGAAAAPGRACVGLGVHPPGLPGHAAARCPAAAETRAFLADARPDKRERLIDVLLARPEFAEYWAQKWSDLLRNEEKALDHKGVAVFYRWIAAPAGGGQAAQRVRPRDPGRPRQHLRQPAGELLPGRPRPDAAGRVGGPGVPRRPPVGCARCHNHPFDRWTNDDYYGFVGALRPHRLPGAWSNDRKDDARQARVRRRAGRVHAARRGGGQPADEGRRPAEVPRVPPRPTSAGRRPARRCWPTGWRRRTTRSSRGAGEPRLAAPHGPRAGRSERRLPRHQPAVEPGAARLPGQGLRGPRLPPQAAGPARYDLAGRTSSRPTAREPSTMGDDLHSRTRWCSRWRRSSCSTRWRGDGRAGASSPATRWGCGPNQVPAPPQGRRKRSADGHGRAVPQGVRQAGPAADVRVRAERRPGLLQAFQTDHRRRGEHDARPTRTTASASISGGRRPTRRCWRSSTWRRCAAPRRGREGEAAGVRGQGDRTAGRRGRTWCGGC